MRKASYYSQVLTILQQLHAAYPNYNMGRHLATALDEYGDIWTYRFPTTGDYMQEKKTKADGTLVTNWTNITHSGHQTFRMPGETEKISADNRNDTGRNR